MERTEDEAAGGEGFQADNVVGAEDVDLAADKEVSQGA